jgi:hypothetical protein
VSLDGEGQFCLWVNRNEQFDHATVWIGGEQAHVGPDTEVDDALVARSKTEKPISCGHEFVQILCLKSEVM